TIIRLVRLSPSLAILCSASRSSLSAPLLTPRPDSWVSFVDIAREAGLTAPVIYGGVERQKYILETTGTGVAVFDFDKDGRPDIFLVKGNRLDLPAIPSLLRNQGARAKKNWVILSLEGD